MKWDGRYVAGVSKVSTLKRTTEVIKHREGGDPSSSRKSPGRTEYDAITLDRGVTHDKDFEEWAQQGLELRRRARRGGLAQGLPQGHHHRGLQRGRSAGPFLPGLPLLGLGVQALSDLDANANAVAIEHIKLENEGWQIDPDVAEPKEPQFTFFGS